MELLKVQGIPIPADVPNEDLSYPLASIETEAHRVRWAETVCKAETVHKNKYTYLGFSAYGSGGKTTTKSHLIAVCPEHGKFRQAISHHLKGSGCTPCGYNKLSVAQAYSFEVWSRKTTELYNGKFKCLELLKDVKPPTLRVLCDAHGEFKQPGAQLLNGYGCPKCGWERGSEKITDKIENVIARLHARDTSKAFNNVRRAQKDNLRWVYDGVCDKHGEFFEVEARGYMSGSRYYCPACGRDAIAESRKYKLEPVLQKALEVHKGRYEYGGLVEREDGYTRLEVVCKNHGMFTQRITEHLLAESGCNKCANDDTSARQLRSWDEVVAQLKELRGDEYDYPEIFDYKGGKIPVICRKHGEFMQDISSHAHQGSGCPSCSGKVSKPNTEIAAFVESLGITAEPEFKIKGHIRQMAIDIKAGNLAIEHLGIHWHSTKYKSSTVTLRDRRTHVMSQGYKFIAIYEDEWEEKRSTVERMLVNKLGVATKSVGARTLQVETAATLQPSDTKFLADFHIQGSVQQGVVVRLKTKDGQLVALAVFNANTSARNEKATGEKWELMRYATADSVQGGLSRCIKAFKAFVPNVRTVISFSEDRLHSGDAYAAVGFKKLYTTAPDYMYVVKSKRVHKSNFQKSKLAKMFPGEDMSLSEKQITEKHKIYRIYDCGKTKWELTL